MLGWVVRRKATVNDTTLAWRLSGGGMRSVRSDRTKSASGTRCVRGAVRSVRRAGTRQRRGGPSVRRGRTDRRLLPGNRLGCSMEANAPPDATPSSWADRVLTSKRPMLHSLNRFAKPVFATKNSTGSGRDCPCRRRSQRGVDQHTKRGAHRRRRARGRGVEDGGVVRVQQPGPAGARDGRAGSATSRIPSATARTRSRGC